MNSNDQIDWSATTWEGSRQAQLRRWLSLTVRERLEAIEQMAEVARHLSPLAQPTVPTHAAAVQGERDDGGPI